MTDFCMKCLQPLTIEESNYGGLCANCEIEDNEELIENNEVRDE